VLDMIFRLQRSSGEERRIVCNAEAFGSAPTLPAAEVPAARLARLRSVVATVASWGPSAGRTIGGRAFVLFLESELVTPLAQCWVVAATAAGAALGWCSWLVPVAMLLLLAFGTSAVTAAALLTRGAFDGAPDAAELRRLVVLAPLEFLIVRPTQAAALLFAPFFTSDRTESAD
jgi:hypothetical protein